jgi:CRISPR-associated endonuclease/helicase Cas3
MRGQPATYWGKLRRDDSLNVVAWHPLIAHCADVAAVTRALFAHSILRDRLELLHHGELTDVHVERLCCLAALHDVGKFNHGFQNRAAAPKGPFVGHVWEIARLFRSSDAIRDELVEALGLQAMFQWFHSEQDFMAFLLSAFAHHGEPVTTQPGFKSSLWEPDDRRDPVRGIASLRADVEGWFPSAFSGQAPPFAGATEFQHAFNGLLTLADWIASDERFFPYADEMDGYFRRALQRARRAVDDLGLNAGFVRAVLREEGRPEFSTIAPPRYSPRPVQSACMELTDHPHGSLSILESDTGSGKTEAALLRFARLFHAGLVDGMYFALPTRTAATQLHGRVVKAMERAFPDSDRRPPVVLAVPGYLTVDRNEGKRLAPFNVLWDDDESWRWHARGWAAENSKRYLAGTVAVGTVDQVLLSALQVKHAQLRASALMRHFLVVDEVHASDVYMDRILESVLDHHLAAGGHAMLMSATLGSAARTRFLNGPRAELESPEVARKTPYPLVTSVNGERNARRRIEASTVGRSKEMEVKTEPVAGSPEQVASLAYQGARAGARVLVIRNTVTACVRTQRVLEELAGPGTGCLFRANGALTPHHSRYAPSDRQVLDAAIERDFGKAAEGGGTVAVATQTVQQSLDLDSDFMISDLCPIDVLLQRVGRLHRHPADRPPDARPEAYRTPRLSVLVPEDRDLGQHIGSDNRAYGPNGLGTVYSDLRVLEATWRLIEEHDRWRIPDMNRELVENGTHPEILHAMVESLGDPWPRHEQWVVGTRIAHGTHAGLLTVRRDKPFGDPATLFPRDIDERIKTRLGTDDRRVEFEPSFTGPFGEKVRVLNVPAHHLPDECEEETPQEVTETDEGVEFTLAGERFVYDRLGLRHVD